MTARKEVVPRPAHPPLVLGWREWVALPGLHVPAIKAKLDTGARSSSLHVADVRTRMRSGREWVSFRVVGNEGPGDLVSVLVADERVVRDSGGREQLRIVIRTEVEIAGWSWPIDVTLARRPTMSFRMLLGRQAVSHHAMVDPSRSYLAGKRRKGKKRP